ncbi:hypothetical protein MRX96_016530 [Rhipicephalus microplus]
MDVKKHHVTGSRAREDFGVAGKFNLQLPHGEGMDQSGLSCDFERGPCTWTNSVRNRGGSEWFVRGGKLRSILPRPKQDHTLGTPQGSYAFLSGARPYTPEPARLVSEYVNLAVPGVQCMDFWFIVRDVAGTKLRVMFEGGVANTKESYVAIDDISVDINSNCRTIPQSAIAGEQGKRI